MLKVETFPTVQVHTPTKADDGIVAATQRWWRVNLDQKLRASMAMLNFCMRSVAFSALPDMGICL